MKNLLIAKEVTVNIQWIFPFLIMLLSLFNVSCNEDAPATNIDEIIFPETNVKYGTHVQPLFDRACAFTGCHGTDTYSERGYSLDNYQSLTPGAANQIVIPYNPNNSILIRAIEGNYESQPRMPLNLPPLNDNQIRGLRRWVTEGAKNN